MMTTLMSYRVRLRLGHRLGLKPLGQGLAPQWDRLGGVGATDDQVVVFLPLLTWTQQYHTVIDLTPRGSKPLRSTLALHVLCTVSQN